MDRDGLRFYLDDTIGYALNRCVILLRIRLAQQFSENGYDVTAEEWVILNRLWQREGRPQNELAETTIKDKTTVTRLLNRMEKKGLITRRISTEDGRVKLVYLTPYARELEAGLIPIAQGVLWASVAEVDEADVATTVSVLKKIEQNLLDFA